MEFSTHAHEQLIHRQDPASGLRAVIAIHSTRLGPAAGGCRHWVYENTEAAVCDALRLAEGMTYKNALADIPFGGGKSVILGQPEQPLSQRQLEVFGSWIEELNGAYITAEDVGMRVADMRLIARKTRFVSGLGLAGVGGDPSPSTALGVYNGMVTAVRRKFAVDELHGLRVAVQGLGNVGLSLCELLARAGARLVVADLNPDRVAEVVSRFGAQSCASEEILQQDVEVIAPCALGSVLTAASVAQLSAGVVAGSANNQLASPEVADLLFARGILYAPDYVINAGGVISIAHEYLGKNDSSWVAERINGIGSRLRRIFAESESAQCSTESVARGLADDRIAQGRRAELRGVA